MKFIEVMEYDDETLEETGFKYIIKLESIELILITPDSWIPYNQYAEIFQDEGKPIRTKSIRSKGDLRKLIIEL